MAVGENKKSRILEKFCEIGARKIRQTLSNPHLSPPEKIKFLLSCSTHLVEA